MTSTSSTAHAPKRDVGLDRDLVANSRVPPSAFRTSTDQAARTASWPATLPSTGRPVSTRTGVGPVMRYALTGSTPCPGAAWDEGRTTRSSRAGYGGSLSDLSHGSLAVSAAASFRVPGRGCTRVTLRHFAKERDALLLAEIHQAAHWVDRVADAEPPPSPARRVAPEPRRAAPPVGSVLSQVRIGHAGLRGPRRIRSFLHEWGDTAQPAVLLRSRVPGRSRRSARWSRASGSARTRGARRSVGRRHRPRRR